MTSFKGTREAYAAALMDMAEEVIPQVTQEQIDAQVWGVVVDSSPSAGSYYTQKDDNFVLLYYY